jgi:hypothetical protein
MAFSVSPSVIVREVDLTTSVPAITTPPAAIAGVFRWGPVNERVLISSEVELANIFGTPTDFNAETFFVAADFLSYSNALYVTRVVSDDAAVATGENSAEDEVFKAKYPGVIANSLEVSYIVTDSSGDNSAFSTEVFEEDSFQIGFNENTLILETLDDLENIGVVVGDTLLLGSEDTGFQALEVVNLNNLSADPVSNTEIEYTHEIVFRQRFTQATEPTTVLRNWRNTGLVGEAPQAGNMHILVFDKNGVVSGEPGIVLERFENLSLQPGAKASDGSNIYYKDVLEQRSRFIAAGSDLIADLAVREYVSLTGGSDGLSESAITFGKVAQGYDLYKEANDVDVSFILQGKAKGSDVNESSLANYLVANITESRRDCIAFISPRRGAVVEVATEQAKLNNVLAFRSDLQNSSYWFMDSGYKYRYDKYNDVFRWVPLNGDMAGLASLVEPWESPAGFRKGRVRNVIKLAFNPNKAQRDQLYGKDVNPVITQVGQGTVLFGDKTGLGTTTGSAFTRINVRRLFITVEKAIATVSAQFLFEFNDEFTQNQFRQIVDPFLRDIQGRRGIIDFRVISDATVNTPQVVDANTFRANIFIAPARSINFIELTFVATRTGVEFEEIVGQQF